MPKINSYQDDDQLSANDRFLGTDGDDMDKTKNFRVSSVINYFESLGWGQGQSAYQVAVTNGFSGSEDAWLDSLVGAVGPQGEQGPQGAAGANGAVGADGQGLTYKEYAARIFQSGTQAPAPTWAMINTVMDTTGQTLPTEEGYVNINYTRYGVGDYAVNITYPQAFPLNQLQIDVSFSDNKVRTTGSQTSTLDGLITTSIRFETRNSSGVLADDQLTANSFNSIYIRIHPFP